MLKMTLSRNWGRGQSTSKSAASHSGPRKLPERPDGERITAAIADHVNPPEKPIGPSIIDQVAEKLEATETKWDSLEMLEKQLIKAFGEALGAKRKGRKGWRLKYAKELQQAAEEENTVVQAYRKDKSDKVMQEARRRARAKRRTVIVGAMNEYYADLCKEIRSLAENRQGVEFFDSLPQTQGKLNTQTARGHSLYTSLGEEIRKQADYCGGLDSRSWSRS